MKKKSLNVSKSHKFFLNHLNNRKINKLFKKFKTYLDKNIYNETKIAVAVSGGPDSLALVYLTKCYLLKNKLKGKFFLVDHKLRKESTKENKLIKSLLKKLNIDCNILTWKGSKPKSNIQGVARNNRYKLLKKACKKNGINYLLIGHHIDDIYENFFIRLLRGSGLKGLSSFGEPILEVSDISILRPMVNFEKKQLVFISKKVFNFFIEDPANQNMYFQRTRVRNLILNLKKDGLDKKKLNLTIQNLKSANNTINFYVNKNIKNNSKYIKKNNTYLLNKYFFNQGEEVVFRSIAIVLRLVSGRYYMPRGKSILNLLNKINTRNFDKLTLGGCYIEKINETFIINKEN